jgi:hypothetical protein
VRLDYTRSVRDGPGGPGQLIATALTQRELALFLGASVRTRRHRELSDKALTPLLGEGRARRLQEEAGADPVPPPALLPGARWHREGGPPLYKVA